MQLTHASDIQARKALRTLSPDAVEVIRSIAYQQIVESSAIEGKFPTRHDAQSVESAHDDAWTDGDWHIR